MTQFTDNQTCLLTNGNTAAGLNASQSHTYVTSTPQSTHKEKQ